MIHDKPWLLLVLATIGFAMTWLVLPGWATARGNRRTARITGSDRPEHGEDPGSRRERDRTRINEELIAAERLRRARHASAPEAHTQPAPAPPGWSLVLGVGVDVDRTALRRAYVEAVKRVHPDCIGPDCPDVSETCAHLAEAYAQGRAHIGGRDRP